MKNTVASLMKMKEKGEKISMLTCYDYSTAKLMEKSGINTILVGDSLGNTMLGYKDTPGCDYGGYDTSRRSGSQRL